MSAVLVHGKTRTLGRELEENSAGLREIDRFEPESIDHRRGARAAFLHPLADFELVRLIVHSPRQMMNAASAPRAAAGRRAFIKIDVGAGFPAGNSIPMPAILCAKMAEAHRLPQKGTGAD